MTSFSELQAASGAALWTSPRADYVVTQGFENGALVGTGVGQFNEGLQDLIEQSVALEAALCQGNRRP